MEFPKLWGSSVADSIPSFEAKNSSGLDFSVEDVSVVFLTKIVKNITSIKVLT